MKSFIIFSLAIIFCVCCAIAIPYISIWAINVLFATSIAYTLKTWLAAFVIIFVINGSIVSRK